MTSDLRDISKAGTGVFGDPYRYFDIIDSTNSAALRWADDGAPEGAVVVADQQEEGRGRWGRSWLSEPGRSLMFSLVLRPELLADRLGLLPLTAGVAVAEAVEELTGIDAGLKWPNDVMAGSRKLAGILVESKVAGGRVEAVVVGIGINFDWPPERLPGDIAERATSLVTALALGAALPSRPALLAAILARFEMLYGWLGSDADERRLVERAEPRSQVLGKLVTISGADGSVLEARVEALDAGGGLSVQTSGGASEITVVSAGEVTRIRER
jgi:BirA family biotin operon repressor/biotin-[acetyl-CoA-carboxylase] ligase